MLLSRSFTLPLISALSLDPHIHKILSRIIAISQNNIFGVRYCSTRKVFFKSIIKRHCNICLIRNVKTFVFSPLGLFDTSNYYTYMASDTLSELAQRGHNKASKHHLRQVGVGLLADRVKRLPLYYREYEGNTHDSIRTLRNQAVLRISPL